VTDEARALLIVAALLFGAGNGTGFVGGRMSVEPPPPEVRIVRMPPRIMRVPVADAAPAEAAPAVAAQPVVPEPPAQVEPAPVETVPMPAPRLAIAKPDPQPKPQPKASPKPEKDAHAKKPRAAASRQRKPTADECAQMRAAGRTIVNAGGRLRGYSDDQIDRAWRDCGF
jgi:hypothetical protein